MNHQIFADDVDEAVKLVNKHRLDNKDTWIFVELMCNGKIVLIKSYNTSIQVLRVNDKNSYDTWTNRGSLWDLPVKEFKSRIADAIK